MHFPPNHSRAKELRWILNIGRDICLHLSEWPQLPRVDDIGVIQMDNWLVLLGYLMHIKKLTLSLYIYTCI